MTRLQLAGFARLVASILSAQPEFSRLGRMPDLGGGPCLNFMAIVSTYPSLKGNVVDFSRVMEKTREYIRNYGMNDRISTLAGDLKRDDPGCKQMIRATLKPQWPL